MGQKTSKTEPPPEARVAPRLYLVPFVLISLVCAIIILGLAGNTQVEIIDHPRNTLNGNRATGDLITFSLIAGVVTLASCLLGLHHARVSSSASLGAAQAASLVALLLLMLPLASASREIYLRGRSEKLIALEAFVIILTVVHVLYTVLLLI